MLLLQRLDGVLVQPSIRPNGSIALFKVDKEQFYVMVCYRKVQGITYHPQSVSFHCILTDPVITGCRVVGESVGVDCQAWKIRITRDELKIRACPLDIDLRPEAPGMQSARGSLIRYSEARFTTARCGDRCTISTSRSG